MMAHTTAVERNHDHLRHYFEYSSHGIDVVEDGLQEVTFGEYLVERGVVDRFELFRALQLQDRMPGTRIGACIAVLGYATTGRIEQMYAAFTRISTVTLE